MLGRLIAAASPPPRGGAARHADGLRGGLGVHPLRRLHHLRRDRAALLRLLSQATTELTGYALAFGISWALAHALTARAHIRIDVLINHLPDRLRYAMHLLSLAALAVFIGFIAKGAYDLVDEFLLFRATDISLLRTPLWIPQGLWAIGIGVFLGSHHPHAGREFSSCRWPGAGARPRHSCTRAPTRRRPPRRLKPSAPTKKRTAHDRRRCSCWSVGVMVVLGLMGAGPGNVLIWQSLLLVGLFACSSAPASMSAAALGVLGLIVGFAFSDRPFWSFIGQTVWAPSSSFFLVAVPLFLLMGEILLRAGLSERLYRALNVWLDRLPAASCTPISSPAACSRRSRARRSRPPRRWARSRCPSSRRRATTRRCWARLPPAARSAISFRPASPSSSMG